MLKNAMLRPILNLVVYESSEDYDTKYYIESRKIVNKKLGPAKPLSHRTMEKLALEFITQLKPKIYLDDIVDPRIIHINQAPTRERLIWKHEIPSKELQFSDGVDMPAGIYSIPKLIFIYDGEVSVYAYKDNILTAKTKIFKAPFSNIGGAGRVCMGSATYHINVPTSANKVMNEVEKRFFKSRFTHTKIDVKSSTQYVIDHHYNAKNPFDLEILIEANKTLGGLMNASD